LIHPLLSYSCNTNESKNYKILALSNCDILSSYARASRTTKNSPSSL
jgi:hypothetical protein